MAGDAAMSYPGACAACRHQGKRCDANCQLAKYFPADKSEDFQNVERLYGVNNLMKLLNAVPDDQRDKTVETLILEARIRKDFPVHGSLAIEANLRAQIDACEKELEFVNKQLSFYGEKKKGRDQKGKYSMLNESSLSQLQPILEQNSGLLFGYYDQALKAIGPPSEAIYGSDTNFDGYNSQPTLEERADIKPFDIPTMDQIMNSYQHEHKVTNLAEASGESSVGSEDGGKQPIVRD